MSLKGKELNKSESLIPGVDGFSPEEWSVLAEIFPGMVQNRLTRRQFLRLGLLAGGAFLAACAENPVLGAALPSLTPTTKPSETPGPTQTAVPIRKPTNSPKASATQTPVATSTRKPTDSPESIATRKPRPSFESLRPMLDNDFVQFMGPEPLPPKEHIKKMLGVEGYSFNVRSLMFLDSYINKVGITMTVWGFLLRSRPSEARIFEVPSTLGCVRDAVDGTIINPIRTIPLEELSPGGWYYVQFIGVHKPPDMQKVGTTPVICGDVYAGLKPSTYAWVKDFLSGRGASAEEIDDLSEVLTVYAVPELSLWWKNYPAHATGTVAARTGTKP